MRDVHVTRSADGFDHSKIYAVNGRAVRHESLIPERITLVAGERVEPPMRFQESELAAFVVALGGGLQIAGEGPMRLGQLRCPAASLLDVVAQRPQKSGPFFVSSTPRTFSNTLSLWSPPVCVMMLLLGPTPNYALDFCGASRHTLRRDSGRLVGCRHGR